MGAPPADPQAADILQRAAGGWAKDGEEHSQEWLCHKGKNGRVASGWRAVFPASVAVFKYGHDPSTPQDHPGHKERAPLGMTAGEKEREAGLETGDREAEEKSGQGSDYPDRYPGQAVRSRAGAGAAATP